MWLINLVENLLSVTRLEESSMQLNMQVELVDEVIEEALNHISRKREEHQLVYEPVSYTHLDVYKRQACDCRFTSCKEESE